MIFNFFNTEEAKPDDAKGLRETILRSIKEELQKLDGGEGKHIKGINLYIAPAQNEVHLYESAVYFEEEGRFKEEIQRIADDFAIELPLNWGLETRIIQELPAESKKLDNVQASIFIRTRDRAVQKSATALINVINGEADEEFYEIKSGPGRINIGRDKKAQMSDGFFRINAIAFPSDSLDESNRYISRQHAHIEWDNQSGSFLLFADEGGVPPGNKVKIKSVLKDELIKLQSIEVGHRLQDGDQIIVGETAVLEFRSIPEKEQENNG